MMTKRREARSQDDRDVDESAIPVREVVHIAVDYISAITGRQPTQITGLAPSEDEKGWSVEVEVVEERRIPSSADMLALYEIELDADGGLLTHQRTHRYMRGNELSPMRDDKWTVNGD
jgi:Gas vesicle synthesis protein GvpO